MKHLDVRRLTCLLAPIAAIGLTMTLTNTATSQGNRRNYAASDSRNGLPSGTVIPVRLENALGSKSSTAGHKFAATVIHGPDDAGLPDGTRLEGVVAEAVPSSNGRAGSLDLDFRRIVFPDGGTQEITASLYSLSGKAVSRSDGRLVATADKGKDRLKFVGIGAGAGLLLGTITKQNSILSTLLGGGAGYLYNELGNKPKPGNVTLKEGQEFGVRLDRGIAFNSDIRRNYRSGVRQASTGTDRNESVDGNSSVSSDHVRVKVNNERVRFDATTRPYIRNGAVFVPLAAMGKAANFDYRYDSESRVVYARMDQVRMSLGAKTATVNGRRRSLPTTAELRNGVVFVPLQFVAWASEGKVEFDEASGTVNVNTNE